MESHQIEELNSWFKRIHINFTLEQISESLYEPIYRIYQGRIKDYPTSVLIDKEIKDGNELDFIFYSKIYECDLTSQQLDDESDLTREAYNSRELEIADLEKLARKFLDFTQIKRGDIIRFYGEQYRESGKYIYNGTNLEDLDCDKGNGYGYVPETYYINEFPLVQYFSMAMDHNCDIYIKSVEGELKLISIKDEGKETTRKYQTPDNYIIYETLWTKEISNLPKLYKEGKINDLCIFPYYLSYVFPDISDEEIRGESCIVLRIQD